MLIVEFLCTFVSNKIIVEYSERIRCNVAPMLAQNVYLEISFASI